MKRTNLLYIIPGLVMVIAVVTGSCKKAVDDRDAPSDTIKGKIIDAITGKPILTEQPDGIKMRLFEEGVGANLTSIDFWTRSDGTYNQGRIFSSTYKVVPVEGAFFPADTQRVTVNGVAEIDFTVTPFLAVEATITPGSGSVTATYKLLRTKVGEKISDAKIIASSVPTVSNAVYDPGKAVTRNLTAIDDLTILASQYTDVLGGLESGKTYYVRVAARTGGARYNYSPVIKVTVQ